MSEIANIQFGGVANVPSDHMHQDGELSLSVNAVLQDGSIRPLFDGTDLYTFPRDWKLMLIHHYNDVHNYIFYTGGTRGELRYISLNDDTDKGFDITASNTTIINYNSSGSFVNLSVRKVVNVRLVLCISTDDMGVVYARWDGSKYIYLGAIPKLPYIYPFIDTNIVMYDDVVSGENNANSREIEKAIDLVTDIYHGKTYYFGDDDFQVQNTDNALSPKGIRDKVYEALFSMVNSMRSKLERDGKFTSPFYVRFAYLLYDGTCISVSRPMLLMPSSTGTPYMVGYLKYNEYDTLEDNNFRLDVAMPSSTLHAYVGELPEGWDDIITGIDIYVTDCLVNYTDNAETLVEANVFTSLEEESEDDGSQDENTDDEGYDDEGIAGLFASTTIDDDDFSDAGIAYNITNTTYMSKDAYSKLLSHNYSIKLKFNMDPGEKGKFHKYDRGEYYQVYAFMKRVDSSGNLIDAGQLQRPGNGYWYHWIEQIPSTDERYKGSKWELIVTAIGDEEYASRFSWIMFDTTHKRKWVSTTSVSVYCFRLYHTNAGGSDVKYVPKFFVTTARTDGKDFEDVVSEASQFYKLCHIDFKDIDSTRIITPEIGKYALENIVSKETLKSNEVTGYDYTVSDMISYNNRLTAVLDTQKFETPDYFESFCFDYYPADNIKGEVGNTIKDIYFRIVKDGKSYVVKCPHKESGSTIDIASIRYLYYSNINAVTAYLVNGEYNNSEPISFTGDEREFEIESSDNKIKFRGTYSGTIVEKGDVVYQLSMDKHDELMGAYWFDNFNSALETAEKGRYKQEFKCDASNFTLEYLSFEATKFEMWNKITEKPDWMTDAEYSNVLSITKNDITIKMSQYFDTTVKYGNTYTIEKNTGKSVLTLEQLESMYDDATFYSGNKIYQTQVDNPFSFFNSLTCDINCDNIYKLCTISKPLSNGQFGEFPLYAFTDNGIWALLVNSTGTFESVSPVSRDVCTDGDSVTQLDQSILFPTSRGMMELSGDDIACATEILEGHSFLTDLSKIDSVCELSGIDVKDIDLPNHIEDFTNDCRVLYNYKKQLVYLFKDDENIAYVMDLGSKAWGMMHNNKMAYSCGEYTDAKVVCEGITSDGTEKNKIVNMSIYPDFESKKRNSLIITRPLTFGQLDSYKTIEDIILRGVFDNGSMKLVVWASNNLKDWYIIGTSSTHKWRNYSGTPYKAYRLGVIANWKEQDSLTGADIIYNIRANNKIR